MTGGGGGGGASGALVDSLTIIEVGGVEETETLDVSGGGCGGDGAFGTEIDVGGAGGGGITAFVRGTDKIGGEFVNVGGGGGGE